MEFAVAVWLMTSSIEQELRLTPCVCPGPGGPGREGTKAESGESTSDEASTTGVGSSEGHTVAGQARETLQQMSLDLGSLSADPLYVSSTVPAASVARDE